MRASRQTELQREFPIHVVCRWLGNSPQIITADRAVELSDGYGAGFCKIG
jgi:hypothetical protein